MSDTQTNGGNELPASRLAAVEQGMLYLQEVAAERDKWRSEAESRIADITALKIACEALQAQLADAESRVATARIERDQMADDLSVYRVLFQSFGALIRTFEIEHAPLVRQKPHDAASYEYGP